MSEIENELEEVVESGGEVVEAFSDDEVSLEELKQLPGADKLSDEELLEMWNGSKAEEEKPAATPAQVKRNFKYFGSDDKEIAEIENLTVAEFLKGKIGYTANSKEQRKTLDELLRVAQYGHLNETKLTRAQAEREAAFREREQLSKAVQQHVQNEKTWSYALQQFALGNDKPLETLIAKFKDQIGAPPMQAETPTSDREAEIEGMRLWYDELQPKADAVAQRYGAKAEEVRNYVQYLIGQEVNLTRERIDEIIDSEIPLVLEQYGYAAQSGEQSIQQPNKTAALEAELNTLKTQMANMKTEALRKRNKALPPSSGGRGGVDAEHGSVPAEATKSREAYKKFLKN